LSEKKMEADEAILDAYKPSLVPSETADGKKEE
jgi:hypothetical protein